MLTVNQINELKTKVENLKDVLRGAIAEIDEVSSELYEFAQMDELEITDVMYNNDHELEEFHTLLDEVKEMSQNFPCYSDISVMEERCRDTIEELDNFIDFVDSYEEPEEDDEEESEDI